MRTARGTLNNSRVAAVCNEHEEAEELSGTLTVKSEMQAKLFEKLWKNNVRLVMVEWEDYVESHICGSEEIALSRRTSSR